MKADPLLGVYERGLKALHKGKLADAEKLFTRVVKETDQGDVAERARQYLAVCQERKASSKKGGKVDDAFLEAVYEANNGNHEAALAICSRGGRQGKDERFAYLAAAVLAATEELDRAAEMLAQAIELNPKNRVHAYHDSDFAELRSHPEHRQLFERP